MSRTIEDQNHVRLAELAGQEEAFSGASAAIQVATADIRREAGLGERDFTELAA